LKRSSAPLRAAALETPHVFGRPDEVLAAIDHALSLLPSGIDLVLLSECALTGYVSPRGSYDLKRFAEPLDGPTTKCLSALAKKHNVALAGPLIEREGQAIYNTLVLFDSEETLLGLWRKRHPWYPEHWATPGNLNTSVIRWRGCAITACICFDIHFIGQEAPDSLTEADLMLYPSAWVDSDDSDARTPILGALATQFDVTILNANWGVGVPDVRGQGRSRGVLQDGSQYFVDPSTMGAFVTVDTAHRVQLLR
jgi:5-aminopentanamidase